MSVSDLTGTKWVLNSIVTLNLGIYAFDINFTSNNVDFTSVTLTYWLNGDQQVPFSAVGEPDAPIPPEAFGETHIIYNNIGQSLIIGAGTTGVNIVNTWTDQAYRIIEITGGTDATNSDLISWLEDNATYQEPVSTTRKLIKFNNHGLRRLNNKHIHTFNGVSVVGGYPTYQTYEYQQSGDEVTTLNAPYTQSNNEVTLN